MAGSWQDKEVERWLESERRVLLLPNGEARPFTGFKLMWHIHDRLVTEHGYSPAQMVKWAVEETAQFDVSFETAFPAIVAYVDSHTRKRSSVKR